MLIFYFIFLARNPGFKTIEEELMKAFRDSGGIPDEWYDNMQQAFFQRASRCQSLEDNFFVTNTDIKTKSEKLC